MILYHPIDDIYHCFYRLSLILSRLPINEYELKKIQILDFYFLFPGLIKKIRWPKELSLHRQYFNKIPKPYSEITDEKAIIIRLEHQVKQVVHYMTSYDLLDVSKVQNNILLRKNDEKYRGIIEKLVDYDNDLLDFLVNVLARIPLDGKDGLKSRTELFEYRYDNV